MMHPLIKLLFCGLVTLCPNLTLATTNLPPIALYVGNYNIIGQDPITGKVFKGTAVIDELTDKKLQITQHVQGQKPIKLTATLRKAAPGEGAVLIAIWPNPSKYKMSCLTTVDLDNYVRLTCVWGTDSTPAKSLGLAAFFPEKS